MADILQFKPLVELGDGKFSRFAKQLRFVQFGEVDSQALNRALFFNQVAGYLDKFVKTVHLSMFGPSGESVTDDAAKFLINITNAVQDAVDAGVLPSAPRIVKWRGSGHFDVQESEDQSTDIGLNVGLSLNSLVVPGTFGLTFDRKTDNTDQSTRGWEVEWESHDDEPKDTPVNAAVRSYIRLRKVGLLPDPNQTPPPPPSP